VRGEKKSEKKKKKGFPGDSIRVKSASIKEKKNWGKGASSSVFCRENEGDFQTLERSKNKKVHQSLLYSSEGGKS